ncbi:metallophosphoesterase [Oligella urethralis]|uniref:Uncharacterized protein conserved in bacteria n=1 Tax=Oligella urethralis TaxID=90245 RepID=A0A2X1ULV0_9BURK|nr:metallophosphoesterase [Oligella urethralis]SPY08077.1 Uncharacterized protein conserved in bacteria [Oligella urethralis]
MKSMLVISDCHVGTSRTAGVTPSSAAELYMFLLDELERILNENTDKDVFINGDLFDKFTEENFTVEATLNLFIKWIKESGNLLYLCFGNHDKSAKGDKLSSFDLLANVLKFIYPDNVITFESKFTKVRDGVYVIPHCFNQFLFNAELEKALEEPITKGSKLLLHVNYLNPFSAHSDHSLTVDEEQLAALIDHGYQVLGSHEHLSRSLMLRNGTFITNPNFDVTADLLVLGNQTPSSISDCLSSGYAQKDGKKYAHVIHPDNTISRIETWDNKGNFISVDWQELDKVGQEKFIRVEGQVSQAEVEDVFSRIAKFRNKSNAFIVTNAVKVEGLTQNEEDTLDISLESIKAFDVKGEFLKLFTEEEQAVLKEVMGDDH